MWFGDLVTMTVVGRPVAQRVVRRVHVAPDPRRRHRVHRRVGRLRRGAQGLGVRRGADSRRPTRSPASPAPDAAVRAAELRRDLLRQGRGDAAPADRLHRRRRVHRRRPRPPDASTPTATATLADFLAAMERASGKDLQAWADAWLRTARLDTVSLDVETDGGVVTAARLHRTAPAGEAAAAPAQPGRRRLHRRRRGLPGRRPSPSRTSPSCPRSWAGRRRGLVVPNAGDLTWATVRAGRGHPAGPARAARVGARHAWPAPCCGPP